MSSDHLIILIHGFGIKGYIYALKLFFAVSKLRIARMDMEWNLKKLGQLFQVLTICLQKSPKKYYGLVFPGEICSVSTS